MSLGTQSTSDGRADHLWSVASFWERLPGEVLRYLGRQQVDRYCSLRCAAPGKRCPRSPVPWARATGKCRACSR